MAAPLRIAAHNGARVWGGAEIAVARLVAGLARRGHDARLFCGDPEVAARAATLGAPVAAARLGGDVAIHDAVRFARQLRGQRPQVLLLGTFRKLWLGALAGRLAGVPRTVARIGLETDLPRNLKYRLVMGRWIDAVAFNADAMRHAFLASSPWYGGRVETIRTGIRPVVAVGGEALRAELGISAAAPVVGSVGRLAEQKRYDRLVRAMAALPDAHLLVVGEGPERAALEGLADELGVAARVHLPGHRDDVAAVLDAMDLFVLCSEREGLSNAMLEALSAGVPVVSTDVSGAAEALAPSMTAPGGDARAEQADEPSGSSDRSTVSGDGSPGGPGGLRVAAPPPGRIVGAAPGELERTLTELLADAALLREMGAAARRVAAVRFDEDRMLDEWEALLREVTG